MKRMMSLAFVALALCAIPWATALGQFGGKPLATQTIDGEEVSILSVERKRVFRDQFGEEHRAKDGEQWIVVRMQFLSPKSEILHSPLAIVDAAGQNIPPEGRTKIHFISEPAPGTPSPPPKPEFVIPMESTVLFPLRDGSEPKTLNVGRFSFEIARFLAPPQQAAVKGAVVRGRVLEGRFVLDAKPLADTPVALIDFPQAKEQQPDKKKKKGKSEEMRFLSIAQQTRCDEEGKFAFQEVAPGTYLLGVTATIGTSTGMRNVTLDGKDAVIEIAAESDLVEVTVLVDGHEARRTRP